MLKDLSLLASAVKPKTTVTAKNETENSKSMSAAPDNRWLGSQSKNMKPLSYELGRNKRTW